jgi:hypothetical protein
MNEEMKELIAELAELKLRKAGMVARMEGLTTRLTDPSIEKDENELNAISAELDKFIELIERNNKLLAEFNAKLLAYKEKWG